MWPRLKLWGLPRLFTCMRYFILRNAEPEKDFTEGMVGITSKSGRQIMPVGL